MTITPLGSVRKEERLCPCLRMLGFAEVTTAMDRLDDISFVFVHLVLGSILVLNPMNVFDWMICIRIYSSYGSLLILVLTPVGD